MHRIGQGFKLRNFIRLGESPPAVVAVFLLPLFVNKFSDTIFDALAAAVALMIPNPGILSLQAQSALLNDPREDWFIPFVIGRDHSASIFRTAIPMNL